MTLEPQAKVTFVGIGAIGLPMAHRIHEAGYQVTAVDPSPVQRQAARELDIFAEASPDSATSADVVVLMVATPEQLRTACLGPEGLIARMQKESILLVMSTVGPDAVTGIASEAAGKGIEILDVPVTGGVAGAKTGRLRLLASGHPRLIDKVDGLLSHWGTVVDCGTEIGMGQSYKAVNQLLCSVHIVAAAEALALGERLGLDKQSVLDAVSGGAAASWMLSDRGPRMLEGIDAEVTSSIGIFVKDSGLVHDIAESHDFDAPLLETARQKYLTAADAGHLNRDDSQVIQTYRNA